MALELHEAAIYKKSNKYNDLHGSVEKDDKIFVAFDIDRIREKRPYLLSRDMVYARPSDKKVEPFQVSLFLINTWLNRIIFLKVVLSFMIR